MSVAANSSQGNVDRLAYERKVVEPFVGSFGWRTLFNVVWPVAGWAATLALYTNGAIPLIAAIALCAVFIQALYMPVHESVHRTISAGRSRCVWLDRAVGSFAAWVLCTSFVDHRHTHLLHHTHANDEEDPDILNAKGSPKVIAGRIVFGAISYPLLPLIAVIPGGQRVLPTQLKAKLAKAASFRSDEARQGARLVAFSHIALLAVAPFVGLAVEVWVLWYLAGWLGRFWLSIVFGWLPHHPHSEVGRYRDTRIFTFRFSTFLIRGHDYHLLHHLFPRVPHYKLRRLWKQIGSHLASQGARIEGKAARELGIVPQ